MINNGTITYKLDAFEGPLDLLLHLISKHKLSIYDIEISLLLEQYLDYIADLEYEDYEYSADFLKMAAQLIYIKTCSLLPQPEEAETLKRELEGRLIEYSLCKQAAAVLSDMYAGGSIFVRAPVKLPVNRTYTRTHEVGELFAAYMGISSKTRHYTPLRANMFSPIVSKRIVSVTSKIIFVLKKLYRTGVCDMSELYDGINDRSEKVATFLAVLELTKSGRIYISDDNEKIMFRRREKKRGAVPSDMTQTEEKEPDDTEDGNFSETNGFTDNDGADDTDINSDTDSQTDTDTDANINTNTQADTDEQESLHRDARFSCERSADIRICAEYPFDAAAVAASAPMIPQEDNFPAQEEENAPQNFEKEIDEDKCGRMKYNFWRTGRYYWYGSFPLSRWRFGVNVK